MSKRSNQPRLTIDTNNVISGTISPGNYASHLLTAWSKGELQWIQTPQTFQELRDVLHREKFRIKYGLQKEEVEGLINAVAAGTTFVTPLSRFELPLHSRDMEDDKFLACAFAGECDYLITDDNDLLTLNRQTELGTLQIIKAAEYLRQNG